MQDHLRVLAWLHIALNGLHLLGALAVWLVFAVFGGVAAVGAGGAEGAAWGGIITLLGTIVLFLLAITAIPGLILGWGLLNRAGWARILGLVLSALMLPVFPLGTLLGIYGFWVLLNEETNQLLNPRANTY